MTKKNPVPTRFEQDELELLAKLKERFGMSNSDAVRRAVRLLAKEVERRGADLGWIEETAPTHAGKRRDELAEAAAQRAAKRSAHK